MEMGFKFSDGNFTFRPFLKIQCCFANACTIEVDVSVNLLFHQLLISSVFAKVQALCVSNAFSYDQHLTFPKVVQVLNIFFF